MARQDIIVIGGSVGGIEASKDIIRDLPADLPAAVFVVIHVSPKSEGVLARILGRAGKLAAATAQNGERIRSGRIYVAPPDYHVLVKEEYVELSRGPKENNHRPAINPLFRSAALAYGPRVIGLVLSGSLDDGSAGLVAIKKGGGTAIVQDPEDAPFPDMPRNALAATDVDYCLPKSEIAAVLARLAHVSEDEKEAPAAPTDMKKEAAIEEVDMDVISSEEKRDLGH